MKLNKDYVLREVANTWVVLPLQGADLDGIMKLNESGVLLWNALEQGADIAKLAETLTAEYEVTIEQAKSDVREFIALLQHYGCLEV